jgi:hypothetical protein
MPIFIQNRSGRRFIYNGLTLDSFIAEVCQDSFITEVGLEIHS